MSNVIYLYLRKATQGRDAMKRVAKYPEILLSEDICKRIKDKYFPNASYSTVVNKVGLKFSDLKRAARDIFSDQADIEILQRLSKFSVEDFDEFLEVAEIFLKNSVENRKEVYDAHHVSQKTKLNGAL